MGLHDISYKPLHDREYGQKYFIKQQFHAKIKVPIVQIFYMGYLKFYYA
jgi:hypothetical protein